MVGRILGLLPCLARIPAALELQSIESVYGAVAELLPGALHKLYKASQCWQYCCTPASQQPLEANSGKWLFCVLARKLTTSTLPAAHTHVAVLGQECQRLPGLAGLPALGTPAIPVRQAGSQVEAQPSLPSSTKGTNDHQPLHFAGELARARPCKAGRTMKIVVRLTCKSMGSDIGREPGNPSGQPADMSSC